MDLVKVKSTNISAVGYDGQSRTLRVLFLEGSMYDYTGVPAGLHNQLMTTESKGSFFKDHIREQFEYTKVNLAKERKTMGQNKAQKQAAERAKKSTAAPEVQPQPAVAEQPKPTPAPPPAAPASKQTATLDKLKTAWTERKVDLSNLTIQQDGKFILVSVDDGWPVIQIGASGGIVLPQIRSYPKAWDAAIDGLSLFQKQNERDAKKAAASAPKPAPARATPPPAAARAETPAAKKAKAHEQIEQQFQSA